ncbi:MAG: DNA polymerase III subunit beta [Gammaproteobacteria bacterium]
MDIIVQRDALLKPLQAVSGVVEKKQTLPILSNVLLTVKDGNLLLTGTDLEIELVGFVAIEKLSAEGSVTVSARKLFDICRTLPENTAVSLTLEKNHLVVKTGSSRFLLNTLSPQDFPSLEDMEYSVEFPLNQSQFKQLMTKTYFAMGQQDVRHYLNGSFLDINQNSVKCIAADGHRLALAEIQDERIGNATAKVILPRKSVLELIRLLGNDTEQDAKISIGESRFRIVTPEFIFTSKLINAQYPDYNRLIPKGSTTSATGERESIKQALTRASILSNEKFRGVRFQFEDSKLRITANNSDQEHAEEAVDLDYAGNTLEIGFNVAYLLDVVSAITTKLIRCTFTDSNNGVLIEPADGDQSLYVVMPMRL